MSDYQIRLVENDVDRAAVYRLRYDLYVVEQGLFRDVADHERRWLHEDLDEHTAIWIAEHDGQVVGTSRAHLGDAAPFARDEREAFDMDNFADIIDDTQIAVLSRAMVTAPHRGGQLVFMLFHHMLRYAVEHGTQLILGECEPHLVNRWIRLGFRPFGLCEHPINGTLVRMAMPLGDHAHMEALQSPLAPILATWSRERDTAMRLGERLAQGQHFISELEDRARYWDAVESVVPRTELAQLLGGLTDQELDALLGNGHALACSPGSMLIRKGHVSRTLYILLTGSLVVRDEGVVIVEVQAPGSVLGEVALFSGRDRMSDVLVGEHGARVLALSERNLRSLIEEQGAGAAKFLLSLTRGLCTKLRERSDAASRSRDARQVRSANASS